METRAVATAGNRPYFLWDYDLSEADVHAIMRGEKGSEKETNTLLLRIKPDHADDR